MIGKTKQALNQLTFYQMIFLLLLVGTFLYVLVAGKHVDVATEQKSVLVKDGLSIKGKNFTIEGQNFRILSGAIHYFRVPMDYWDDRLKKLKAMGLNTVETCDCKVWSHSAKELKHWIEIVQRDAAGFVTNDYQPTPNVNAVLEDPNLKCLEKEGHSFNENMFTKCSSVKYIPWNLHEPEPGVFDFEEDLSLSDFVLLAQTFGLYVIIRPGPYICAEWDLGGLPSWLLRDSNMQLRSSYKPFLDAVDRYFDKLMPILAKLQFSKGGPVIAFQIENEYGSFGSDLKYMRHLKKGFRERGISEFLFVSDNDGGIGRAHIKGTLQTINFQTKVDPMIDSLEKYQPNKPVFVTEFWSGWFDHWGEKHHTVKTERIKTALRRILDRGASFNFYMFHGGTNFGFMNGANTYSRGHGYNPTISSYDYDAPVSETGDLTGKFYELKDIIAKHAPKGSVPEKLPMLPQPSGRVIYDPVVFQKYMPFKSFLRHMKGIESQDVMPMEMLPIKKDCGQAYGYILYTTKIPGSVTKVTIHDAADRVTVLVNNIIVNEVESLNLKHEVKLPTLKADDKNELQILVENCGRINYEHAINDQRKGIRGWVQVDDKKHQDWLIFPLEFKKKFVSDLEDSKYWKNKIPQDIRAPALFKGSIWVQRSPHDCILHIKGWERGAVFLNGRNLGRYDALGPQRTLYIPRSFLRQGDNSVILFESGKPSTSMEMEMVRDLIWEENVDFHI